MIVSEKKKDKVLSLKLRTKCNFSLKICRFDQLKEGLEYLKKEESRRATGPLAFVKENIATFMDAEDTLTGKLA